MYNSSPVYSPMSGELQTYSRKKKQSNTGSLGNRMAGNEELKKYLNRETQTNFTNYTPARVNNTPAASTASRAVTSSGYDPWVNGIPSAKERTEMYEATLTGASKDNFRKQKVATDKYGNESPEQSNYDFYMQLYTQEEEDAKWMETYTGPKTWADTVDYSTSGEGAADRTAAYMKQVLKYQNAQNNLKGAQEFYAKKKKD